MANTYIDRAVDIQEDLENQHCNTFPLVDTRPYDKANSQLCRSPCWPAE
jgi:hypothetical protein